MNRRLAHLVVNAQRQLVEKPMLPLTKYKKTADRRVAENCIHMTAQSPPNIEAIRQALEIARSLVYLAKATPNRNSANVYLVRATEQLQTVSLLLDGISSEERAVS